MQQDQGDLIDYTLNMYQEFDAAAKKQILSWHVLTVVQIQIIVLQKQK